MLLSFRCWYECFIYVRWLLFCVARCGFLIPGVCVCVGLLALAQVYISKIPKEKYLRVDEDGPLAVIMAPTRELAQQVLILVACARLAWFACPICLCSVLFAD